MASNEWTQEELERVFKLIQERSATDPDFRKELLADSSAAIQALTGKALPEGFKLKVIENDPAYTMTYVLPDMVSEKMTDDELAGVNSGISFVLIVSACALAISTAGCGADACGGNVCGGNAGCGAAVCGGDTCAGNLACGGNACGANSCGGDMGVCGGNAHALSTCGGNMGGTCKHNACGGDACLGFASGPCPSNACGAQG